MIKKIESEKLNIAEDRPGLTLEMLKEHFKLYEGYVKKTNEIRDAIPKTDRSAVNPTYSQFAELKRQETFALNGIKLHEIYFSHFGDQPAGGSEPKGEIVEMIKKDFESIAAWKEEMIATGLGARGWAITAFDFKDNSLHIYASDAHNVGAVWGAIPVIVLDIYEHAYFMDYGVDRKSYLNAFFGNLDWDSANKILDDYGLVARRAAR